MFIVDTSYDYAEFDTYREAEIYCGENGISCENIYEEIWKSRKAFSFSYKGRTFVHREGRSDPKL